MTVPTVVATLRGMELLVALAVLQGTLELLAVRRSFSDDGTWRWATLAREMAWLSPLLSYRSFVVLLVVRLFAAILLLAGVHGPVAPLLWTSSLLVNVRFRGTTNGGSDMMIMVVLGALVLAHLMPHAEWAQQGAVLYVAAQAFMSYFIAGVAKLASAAWRDGGAMRSFLLTPHLDVPPPLVRTFASPNRLRAFAWGVMTFECAAPVALLHPLACVGYIAVALVFHLANAWALGLNRFVLAWAATWPALLYASSLLS